MTISFYSPRNMYGFLSNFYLAGFYDDNEIWYETSEHYYQAHKFVGTDHFDIILTADTPKIAAIAGRNPLRPLRSDWENVKLNIMLDALRFKFTSSYYLEKSLLGTGYHYLVEASPKDYFWGSGKDSSGENWLGKLLMIVRDELR